MADDDIRDAVGDEARERIEQICCWEHVSYDGRVCAGCGGECNDCSIGLRRSCRRYGP